MKYTEKVYIKKQKKYVIGVDIGGTKIAIILGDTEVNILDRIAFSTNSFTSPNKVIDEIINNIEKVANQNNIDFSQIESIGISSGGPLDLEKGLILSPPNLPGWDSIPIVKIVEEKFGIPTYLENDANSSAIAEWKFGAGKGSKNMIFLTFGTGMGAGLILNGRLYPGANGMAGEVGHIRLAQDGPMGHGKRGSFEGFCSGGGITRLAKTEIAKRLINGEKVEFCPSFEILENITAKDVALAAEKGDSVALEIFQISARYLGLGLSILIDILNPEKIILGTIFVKSRHLLQPIIEEVIRKEALELSAKNCEILPAELGEKIGDYAALCVALKIGVEEG